MLIHDLIDKITSMSVHMIMIKQLYTDGILIHYIEGYYVLYFIL